MKSISKALALIAAAFVISAPANAEVLCTQTINKIEQHYSGSVILHFDWGVPVICSVRETLGNITPSACQSWLSLFMTQYIQGKPIALYFNDNVNTCSAGPYELRQPQSIHFLR